MLKCKSRSRRSKGGNDMFTIFSSENVKKISNGIMFSGVKSKENDKNCKSKTIYNLARIDR